MTEQLKQVWEGEFEEFLDGLMPKCKPRVEFRGACQERPISPLVIPEVEVVMPAWLAKLVLRVQAGKFAGKTGGKVTGYQN